MGMRRYIMGYPMEHPTDTVVYTMGIHGISMAYP